MLKFAIGLLVVFFLAFIPCTILSLKYRNKYKLYFVFGKKGAGKTTMLTQLAYQYNKKGIKVYCNTEIPGTWLIDAKDVGFYKFDPGSVIMIDEVSLIWDNRNFKNFRPEVAKFFRLQRHHRLTVWLFSQTFDVDKKIRDLTDQMFMLSNFMGWLSYCKEIRRQLVVVEPTENSEARIADTLKIPPWYTAIFGTRRFIFVPRWSKYFDSHLIEEPLPEKEYTYQPYKEELNGNQKGEKPRGKIQTAAWLIAAGLSGLRWYLRYRAVSRRAGTARPDDVHGPDDL